MPPERTVDASHDASPLSPPLPVPPAGELAWQHLHGSSRGLALARAAAQHTGPLVVVAAETRRALQFEEEIRFYADPTTPVLAFPDWECLPYDLFSPHPDIIAQRLLTLHRLPQLTRGVIVLAMPNLMQRLPPPNYLAAHSFLLKRGDRLDVEFLRRQLQTAAYHSVSQVLEPGEYAVRGGLLDLFPMGAARPYRIDLFGDEVESIRFFDPENQRSLGQVDEIRLLPAREFPLSEDGIRRFRQAFRERFEGDPQKNPLYRDVSQGLCPPGIEYYLPLFFDATATFFDYLPRNALVVLADDALETAPRFVAEVAERHAAAGLDRERRVLPPAALFLDEHEVGAALARFPRIHLRPFARPEPAGGFSTRAPAELPANPKAESPYAAFLDYLRAFPGRVLLVAETPGRRELLLNLLHGHALYPAPCAGWSEFLAADDRLGIAVANLERGLVLVAPALAVITEPQLYGEKVLQRRRRAAPSRDPETIIRSLAELRVGDPVVHEEHGVGRYRGLQVLAVGGTETEFLTLEYQDGDKLYVPILSLHLISRYTSADPEHAPLHKLGGKEWDKTKKAAREKAYDAAVELLEIQALRAARKGYAFAVHDDSYAAFAAEFPFEETPDQARAIDEVLADMESDRPMDRLVCGDVGFGKTEVALRAAFLAVQGGRQVAVLVPTTLLAQQHYQNFSDRFADSPFRIELLSRFRSKGDLATALAGLDDGTIDMVIGTHRLLQPDIRFKRLGLVIIDEEHRFGVRQKERLKQLRAQVDVLTLTATPIPRTLNFALAGMRDISIIATPPRERLAIKTFVSEWNTALIREGCLREIRRGGQVYFLHNEVHSMERMAATLHELVPEAAIRIAHGQMPERDLEIVMRDFYHQRFNILLCSTIVESGIDVPTANTIFIHRADKFGLAQLHQLRGRVGRSHHRAYAYLLIPPRAALAGDAHKRLEAIASLEDLGAGFMLASHDLEIRGAGELLGEAQSGLIEDVGFTLYADLLQRAIASLQRGQDRAAATLDRPLHAGTEIDLHIPVLIPTAYLPDVHARLILYKRIASAADRTGLEELQVEMIDRFGLLPDPIKALFRVTALKLKATPLGVRKIDLGPHGGRLTFDATPNVDPGAIVGLIQAAPREYRLDGPHKLRIQRELPEPDDRVRYLDGLLERLSARSQ